MGKSTPRRIGSHEYRASGLRVLAQPIPNGEPVRRLSCRVTESELRKLQLWAISNGITEALAVRTLIARFVPELKIMIAGDYVNERDENRDDNGPGDAESLPRAA